MKVFGLIIALLILFSFVFFCYAYVDSSADPHPPSDHTSVYDSLVRYLHDLDLLIKVVFAFIIVILIKHEFRVGFHRIGDMIKAGIEDLGTKTEEGITTGVTAGFSILEPKIMELIKRWTDLPKEIDKKLNGFTRKVLSYYQKSGNRELQEAINEIEDILFEKKFSEAEFQIRSIFGKYPNSEDVYVLYSKYFAAKGRFDDAEEQLRIAEDINAQNGEIYFARAQNRMAQSDYEGAEEFGELAVSLNPKDPRYLLSLGFIKWVLGKLEKAIKLTKEADLVGTDDPRTKMMIKNNLAYYFAQRGHSGDIDKALLSADEVIQLLEAVKRRKPPGDKQYQTRSYVYLRMYQLKEKKKKWLRLSINNANKALDINAKNKYAVDTLRSATKLLLEHQEK